MFYKSIIALCFLAVSIIAEPYILGADISWVQQEEACGVRYYHNNQRVDPFEVLKDHGFNWVRLRLFVDPTATVPNEPESPYATTNAARCNTQPAGAAFCGLDSTIVMAKRIKAAGMKFLLDFHYSDTWTDPGKQHRPVSWPSNTTQLIARMREYTRETLERFRDEGVLPDMVQVGNENRNAIAGVNVSNITNFAAMINAGIDGVKDVSSDIKIMVHTVNDANHPIGWLRNLINNGVTRIDVFGLSHYEEWHGGPGNLQSVANTFASTALFNDIKFCVVEYGENHRAVNDVVYGMANNRGIGTFVWEPLKWHDVLFSWVGGANAGRHSNANLQLFPTMAEAYGLNEHTGVGRSGGQGDRGRGTEKIKIKTLVSVRGRVLNVSSPDNDVLTVRMIDTRGRVMARFAGAAVSSRPLSLSLTKIPVGKYFVEVRGKTVHQVLPVVVK